MIWASLYGKTDSPWRAAVPSPRLKRQTRIVMSMKQMFCTMKWFAVPLLNRDTAHFTRNSVPACGDELLRSKAGDHNSYRSGDAVNTIVWANKARFRPVFDYYRGLIHLRRTHPAFRMIEAEQVRRHLRFLRMDGNVVAYMLEHGANEDSWQRIMIIYNGSEEPQTIHLEEEIGCCESS